MTRLVGGMCALRRYNGELQTLLIQNPYWHPITGRPKRLAGEWVFPSSEALSGENTLQAATRAFKTKVFGKATLYNPRKFTEFLYDKQTHDMRIDFYQANADLPELPLFTGGRWMNPQRWIELICSPEFTQKQHRTFIQEGLARAEPPVDVRTRPTATLEALLKLAIRTKPV